MPALPTLFFAADAAPGEDVARLYAAAGASDDGVAIAALARTRRTAAGGSLGIDGEGLFVELVAVLSWRSAATVTVLGLLDGVALAPVSITLPPVLAGERRSAKYRVGLWRSVLASDGVSELYRAGARGTWFQAELRVTPASDATAPVDLVVDGVLVEVEALGETAGALVPSS